jgi:hypothetical protein
VIGYVVGSGAGWAAIHAGDGSHPASPRRCGESGAKWPNLYNSNVFSRSQSAGVCTSSAVSSSETTATTLPGSPVAGAGELGRPCQIALHARPRHAQLAGDAAHRHALPVRGTVGETMVVAEGLAEFVPSQQVAILRVTDTDEVDPWYLGAWFSADEAREQLRRLTRGMGIQRIPIRELASLTVKLPTLARQREISRRFLAFETAIKAHRAVAACLEDLREVDLIVAFADLADRAADSSRGKAVPHDR